MNIDNDPITLEEFESIFRKNNRDSAITKKSLDDYMELFINFKLKVKEAKALGLDTVGKFRQELEGYRAQLARPYLTDNTVLDELVKEAYNHSREEVKASHILIKCDPTATPDDTLRAWNRLMAIKQRLANGEDFAKIAAGMSEDPSAKDNNGELGYFTAFQMVYPFEEAAYNTKVGAVSNPVRTRYGYHLVKVEDRRPARGEIHVEHIMIKPKQEADAEKNAEVKIREIYEKVKKGESFEELASKYSDDGSSSKKGGELPWFGAGKMVTEFEDASFTLAKDGDISEPFKTSYGWHIVKRIGYKPLPTFNEMEKELKSKVSKDSRAEKTRANFIIKLKDQYHFTVNEKILKTLMTKADSSVFKGNYKVKKGLQKKPLFTLDGNNYLTKDFVTYLNSRKNVRTKLTPSDYIKNEFQTYSQNSILKYEDGKLEGKNPAFRLLMNEYRDGILLFELTDQKVWSKAAKDSAGIENYYENHKDKFMWPERVEAMLYTCLDEKTAEQARKMLAEGKSRSEIASELNKDSQLFFQAEEGVFAKEDRDVLAKIAWTKGMSPNVSINGQVMFVEVRNVLPPAPKKLSECRGMVTSEYQNYLEAEWIKELRSKYKVTVNKDVLYSIH